MPEGGGKVDYYLLKEDILANKDQLNEFDQRILYHLQRTTKQVHKYFDKFMLGEALNEIIQFAWSDLCDWYIEISKHKQSPMTLKVLLFAMGSVLALLHPFLPFVTEKLWKKLGFDGFLMVMGYPKEDLGIEKNYKLNLVLDLIKGIRALKVENNVAPQEVVVGIAGREEILNLVKKHSDLIKKLVKAEQIVLSEEGLGDEFVTKVVENMVVGIQLPEQA